MSKRPQEFETLVRKLMGVPTNAADLRNVKDISFKLLRFIPGKGWKQLSVVQKQQKIQDTAKLLWGKYIQKLSVKSSPEEAAEEAIDEVIDALLESAKSIDV
jgi:hypothetical protein